MVDGFDDFMRVWGHSEVQHARHKICEAISGRGRWSNVVETQNKSGKCNGHTWGMFAEKR
jgi:hypothetical protein